MRVDIKECVVVLERYIPNTSAPVGIGKENVSIYLVYIGMINYLYNATVAITIVTVKLQ